MSIQSLKTYELKDAEFNKISKMVHDKFGINLNQGKRKHVVGRLQKLLRVNGFSTYSEYIDYVENDPTDSALYEIVNKMSTNFTYFFREEKHFDYLVRSALPELILSNEKSGSRDLRVWCAGCSTGEESYSIAMMILELFGNQYSKWNASILATDISENALQTAIEGIYDDSSVSTIPHHFKNKYFNRIDADNWQVNDTLKKEITHMRFNLVDSDFPFEQKFHIIFCRNVMTCFDEKTKINLVRKFHDFTRPEGHLFIGHSETLAIDQSLYKYVMPALYKKA